MTADQFIKSIENYYGAYRAGMRNAVYAYLEKRVSQAELSKLQAWLYLHNSAEYGFIPDVATLRHGINEIRSAPPAQRVPLIAETAAQEDDPARREFLELLERVRKKAGD